MACGSRAIQISVTRSGRCEGDYDGIDDIDQKEGEEQNKAKQSTHGRQVAVRRNIITLDGLASLWVLNTTKSSANQSQVGRTSFFQG